jgi:hypothetical protein
MDFLDKFITVYIDDVLIYSENEAEYELHVCQMLEQLRAADLHAAIHKCEFHVTKTKFLGFIIATDRIHVDPAKVAVILEWKTPTTVRGV